MLGDFNEWFWPASLRGALGRELPARTQHATFPSWYPLFRLERGEIPLRESSRHHAASADGAARPGPGDSELVLVDVDAGREPLTHSSGPRFIAGGHRRVNVIDGDETRHRHPYRCASG